jgi:hypothetical protein
VVEPGQNERLQLPWSLVAAAALQQAGRMATGTQAHRVMLAAQAGISTAACASCLGLFTGLPASTTPRLHTGAQQDQHLSPATCIILTHCIEGYHSCCRWQQRVTHISIVCSMSGCSEHGLPNHTASYPYVPKQLQHAAQRQRCAAVCCMVTAAAIAAGSIVPSSTPHAPNSEMCMCMSKS